MSERDRAMRPFEPFDISVLGADGHLWLSAHSAQGSVYGVPRPLPELLAGDYPSTSDWLKEAIGQARSDADGQARLIGQRLSELLFGVPEIATLLQQTRGVATARGAQVLLRVLAAPDALGAWPWELTLDPQQPDRFLTRARDTHIVRAGRSRTYPVRSAPIEPPLNVLLVLSSPLPEGRADTEAVFDLYEEKRALLAELSPLVDRGLLRVDVEDRPSLERLRSRLGGQRRGFHILHYLGHAQPAGLKLESRTGRGRLVASADFSGLLQQLPDLRLAVFAGCETARAPLPAAGEAIAWPGQLSTADYCVRDACPMVIGMQAVLPFGTERLFTRYFYQALTAGHSVAEALRLSRLAIAGDEHAGGPLLNWAVPCLYVGGSDPGPLLDPDARATAVPPRRRVGVRLAVTQGELHFISRLVELREAVDVLSGRSPARVVMITGLPGTGKSSFLDRCVEELDAELAYLLVSAHRLLEEDDPLEFLCTRVVELLNRTGRKPPAKGRDDASAWWERLLEDLADTPLALALDDTDALVNTDDERVTALCHALAALTRRRGRARLALAGSDDLLVVTTTASAELVRKIRLEPLSWPEIWQWIRRNLPVLTRLGEGPLSGFYADLPKLEDWERLADAVASQGSSAPSDIAPIVQRLKVEMGATTPAAPPVFGDTSDDQDTEPAPTRPTLPGERPLRVAIAGPHTDGRREEFARAITQCAAAHHVAGRVTDAAGAAGGAKLAELLALPSPFADGASTLVDIVRWFGAATEADADIVLLDFGSDQPSELLEDAVGALAKSNALILAAGGNSGQPCYPAWYRGVLAVGALEPTGEPAPYSVWFADAGKPELFAPKSLAGTALAAMVEDANGEGTSFAAMHAMATAIVTWATDRGLTAPDVREILITTARETGTSGSIRALDAEEALAFTRRQLLLDALERGSLGLHELLAETGMRPELALPLLDEMVSAGTLRRVTSRADERYENPKAVYLVYEKLRASTGAGPARTAQLEELVARIRTLARRSRFCADEVRMMWESGAEGRRIAALGAIEARPDLGSPAIVIDAVRSPRTPFEQYHALLTAEQSLDRFTPADEDELLAAIGHQREHGLMRSGRDRLAMAAAIEAAIAKRRRAGQDDAVAVAAAVSGK